jgi:putative oxidoreductase
MRRILYYSSFGGATSLAVLAMRAVIGLAFMFHGWPKIRNPMAWMGADAAIPPWLQLLAALSEFGGGLAWILGLLTPLASFGILCTMSVAAASHIMRGDPFVARGPSYELALVYWTVALFLLFAGPGRFSMDASLFGRKR